MKNYSKTLICAFAVALSIATYVPVVSNADESDTEHVSEWYIDEKGRIFYYDSSGNAVTGEQEIDGELYLFSQNGVQKTGWRTVGGTRRYYDSATGKAVYGWIEYCGKQYYIENDSRNKLTDCIFDNENGDKVILNEKGSVITDTGLTEFDDNFYFVSEDGSLVIDKEIEIDSIPYSFDDNGICETGWVTATDGRTYYYNPDTAEIELGLIELDGSYYYIDRENGMCRSTAEIDGAEYLFNADTGKMETGWLDINENIHYFYTDGTYASGYTEINGNSYVFSSNGILLKGLQNVDGRIYYSGDDGKLLKGVINVGEDVYNFGEDFSAQSGFYESDDSLYYFGENGKMQYGWVTADEQTFYFAEDGKAVSGLIEIDGKLYYFDISDRFMRTGRLIINGNKYYFAEDGSMQYGWVELSDGKYYFGTDGVMLTGLHDIDDNKYYFAENGKMQCGWVTADEQTFYFAEDGKAVSGLTEIDGKLYYFDISDNYMRTGRLIINNNKYYFAEDGSMQYGWVELSDGKYYFGDDGVMLTGWQTIDGNTYYFDESNGKMVTNRVVGDYNLTADGTAVGLSALQQRAKTIIDSVGTDASAIYSYLRSNFAYSFIENTRSLAQIESVGWSYFAEYMLNRRYGVCYYLAAVSDLLFQQAGYQTRIVYGTGEHTTDHYWNQILVNDTWVNYDATYSNRGGVSWAYLQSLTYTITTYVNAKFY